MKPCAALRGLARIGGSAARLAAVATLFLNTGCRGQPLPGRLALASESAVEDIVNPRHTRHHPWKTDRGHGQQRDLPDLFGLGAGLQCAPGMRMDRALLPEANAFPRLM